MLFVSLYVKNKQWLAKIVDNNGWSDDSAKPYSLSVRYQLRENLESIKFVRNIVITLGTAAVPYGILHILVHIDAVRKDAVLHSYLCNFIHLMTPVISLAVMLTALFSNVEYLRVAQNIPFLGKAFNCRSTLHTRRLSTTNEAHQEETALHFISLRNHWNK
ncbi:hypothetical protein Y032_0123g1145 [Ancylostoma ceylanicum]|uniref:Uncharacterized protein n=1 Tax=Ancylostoma ceylanicum TaxID=53326 RepID=A0A016T8L8_9BILA|nr:hypothetical protein Y032_0123g1145 [Ancylostoma ceylanicum]